MRIIFAGTPEFAQYHLQALLDSEHDVVAVYTQPDRKAGRGKKLQASPVKALAVEHDITVHQPLSLKDDAELETLKSYNADLMVVVAYGMLLPQNVLDAPANGCINVHASNLPRWRGAAPIERAIAADDKTTGVTIIQMDAGLDTGDMLIKSECSIEHNETGDSLRVKMIPIGQAALLKAIDGIANRTIVAEKQDDEQSCYAKKLLKHEGNIDWSNSATTIARTIRATTSALKSYTHYIDNGQHRQRVVINSCFAESTTHSNGEGAGKIISIDSDAIKVQTGEGILAINQLQIPGSKSMAVKDLLNGKPDFFHVGNRFVFVDANQ